MINTILDFPLSQFFSRESTAIYEDDITIFFRSILSSPVAEISRMFVPTSQTSVDRWSGAEDHVWAQIVGAAFAKVACPTGYAWFDGHTISHLLIANCI